MSNAYNGLHVNFSQVTLLSRRWAPTCDASLERGVVFLVLWLGFEDVASAASLLLPISTSSYLW
jgi:hypothetical protein